MGPSSYRDAVGTTPQYELDKAAAEKIEQETLEATKEAQRENWLRANLTVDLLNYLVKRERETLERAREIRAKPEDCRDLLAKSTAIREIINYVSTGKNIG